LYFNFGPGVEVWVATPVLKERVGLGGSPPFLPPRDSGDPSAIAVDLRMVARGLTYIDDAVTMVAPLNRSRGALGEGKQGSAA
jgi:hypothetical protein